MPDLKCPLCKKRKLRLDLKEWYGQEEVKGPFGFSASAQLPSEIAVENRRNKVEFKMGDLKKRILG